MSQYNIHNLSCSPAKKIRIIGDLHGRYNEYLEITKNCYYSIQVGDVGFDYNQLKIVDFNNHKVIGGNHCNYDQYYESPHVLTAKEGSKDFGLASHGGLEFFFVRGGFSIDWRARTQMYLTRGLKSYWDQEELSMKDMYNCLDLYKKLQPDFVISHECPRSISNNVGNTKILEYFGYNPDNFSTRTSELLEAMFQFHQPEQWIFGHYHVDWCEEVDGTKFTCLNELGYVDIEI